MVAPSIAFVMARTVRPYSKVGVRKVTDNDVDKIKNISYYRLKKEFARPLSTISKKDGVTSISYNGVEFKGS